MRGSPPSSPASRSRVSRARRARSRRRARAPPSRPWTARSPLQAEQDCAVAPHAPGSDMIEMVVCPHTACRAQLLERRLDVAGLVDRAAEDRRFAAVPVPQATEACVALGEDGRLQLAGWPAAAAAGAPRGAGGPSAAAPGQAADLPPTPLRQADRVP